MTPIGPRFPSPVSKRLASRVTLEFLGDFRELGSQVVEQAVQFFGNDTATLKLRVVLSLAFRVLFNAQDFDDGGFQPLAVHD